MIYILEDDNSIRELVVYSLKSSGMEVMGFERPSEFWEQMKKAYYPRLKPGTRTFYDRLIGEIVEQISACSNGSREEALKDTYFIGYYLQRNALYTSQNNKENHEEEEV